MNLLAVVAGALTLLAAGIHIVVGGREFRLIRPPADDVKRTTIWLQALSGWHWVSITLVLAGTLFLAVGMADLLEAEAESSILLGLAVYFAACGLVWLTTVVFAGRGLPRRLLLLSQWLFCFLIAGLALAAR